MENGNTETRLAALFSWLKDNAKKGVELNRLLAQLRSKGFSPFANPEVMQWALATGGLDRSDNRKEASVPQT